MRVGSHAAPARRRQRCKFLPEFAIFIEQLLWTVAPHPLFELLEVLGILEVGNRHLMGTPRPLDRLAVDELGTRFQPFGVWNTIIGQRGRSGFSDFEGERAAP